MVGKHTQGNLTNGAFACVHAYQSPAAYASWSCAQTHLLLARPGSEQAMGGVTLG